MMRSPLKLYSGLLTLAFTILAWVTFAPLEFGGSATYVILVGNSMTPEYDRGDLVVVRKRGYYQIGDVVAYRSPNIGVVFHRIVDTQGTRFVLKGDNNAWMDSYYPATEEVVGKLWLHFPLAGGAVELLRSPSMLIFFSLAVSAVIIAIIADVPVWKRKPKRDTTNPILFSPQSSFSPTPQTPMKLNFLHPIKPVEVKPGQIRVDEPEVIHLNEKRKNSSMKYPVRSNPNSIQPDRQSQTPNLVANYVVDSPKEGSFFSRIRPEGARTIINLKENALEMLYPVAALGLASLLLAFLALTRPLNRTVIENLDFTHIGSFSYTAPANTDVYDEPSVQPGEPIFRRLSDSFTVTFDYQFLSEHTAQIQGTHHMMAEISDINGWKRTVDITPTRDFHDSSFIVSGIINFSVIQALIDNLESQTGIVRDHYTLTVKPEIKIAGTLDGVEFDAGYLPILSFGFDPLQVQLLNDSVNGGSPLLVSQPGLVSYPADVPNDISIFGFPLKVSTARYLSIGGIILTVLVISVLGWQIYKLFDQGSESSRIEVLYGSKLITVHENILPRNRTIEVASMQELAKIAERDQSMIMHALHGSLHHYFIQSPRVPDLTYHYQLYEDQELEVLPTN